MENLELLSTAILAQYIKDIKDPCMTHKVYLGYAETEDFAVLARAAGVAVSYVKLQNAYDMLLGYKISASKYPMQIMRKKYARYIFDIVSGHIIRVHKEGCLYIPVDVCNDTDDVDVRPSNFFRWYREGRYILEPADTWRSKEECEKWQHVTV